MMTLSNTNFDQLPSEISKMPLWCVYNHNGFYNAETNMQIDTSNLHHTDFKGLQYCISQVMQKKYDGIALLISAKYQYATIEMMSIDDDYERATKFSEIIKKFNSYTEASDNGFTIICKGSIKFNHESKYINISNQNYIQKITGNIISKNSDIVESQSYLSQLWTECTHANNDLPEKVFDKIEEKETDRQIIDNINASDDFDVFNRLYNGDWFKRFNSEADAKIRLVEIISNNSKFKVKTQIMRIFGESELGKDSNQVVEKIVEKAVNKAPEKEIEKFHLEDSKIAEPEKEDVEFPKGRLGLLAEYVYQSSNRPNRMISLISALVIPLGFCARNFSISGSSLNAYYLLLGNTGIGKNDLAKARSRIYKAMKPQIGSDIDKFIGNSNFASGEGLIAHCTRKSNCSLSIVSEFSGILKKIARQNRTSAEESLRILLLSFYDFGSEQVAGVTYSKAKDDIPPLDRPNISIFAESNPKDVYEALNEQMISSGLLPRFIIMETKALREYNNELASGVEIPKDLLKFLIALAKFCIECNNSDYIVKINIEDEAKKKIKEIDRLTTDEINKDPTNKGISDIYNRVQIKCYKLAALLAIFDAEPESDGKFDFTSLIINIGHVEYAEKIIMGSSKAIVEKYNRGEIGQNENLEKSQFIEIVSSINEFNNTQFLKVCKYGVNEKLHKNKICSYVYILKKNSQKACFKNHRLGATQSIKNTLKNLIEHEEIEIVHFHELKALGNFRGVFYRLKSK